MGRFVKHRKGLIYVEDEEKYKELLELEAKVEKLIEYYKNPIIGIPITGVVILFIMFAYPLIFLLVAFILMIAVLLGKLIFGAWKYLSGSIYSSVDLYIEENKQNAIRQNKVYSRQRRTKSMG